jgi:hypothetical protein
MTSLTSSQSEEQSRLGSLAPCALSGSSICAPSKAHRRSMRHRIKKDMRTDRRQIFVSARLEDGKLRLNRRAPDVVCLDGRTASRLD